MHSPATYSEASTVAEDPNLSRVTSAIPNSDIYHEYYGHAATANILQQHLIPSGSKSDSNFSNLLPRPRHLSSAQVDLLERLPPRPYVERLVRIYQEECAPHYGLPLSDNLGAQLEQHWAHTTDTTYNLLALLFIVLATAYRYAPAREQGFKLELGSKDTHFGYRWYTLARECLSRGRATGHLNKGLDSLRAYLICYAFLKDEGQDSEAWFIIGETVRLAKSMGLHRKTADSLASAERAYWWWKIYEFDRMAGHILGRPYAIQLQHCSVPCPSSAEEYTSICGPTDDPAYAQFLIDISTLASLVTDYHLGPAEKYTPESVQFLDGQLTQLEKDLPEALQWGSRVGEDTLRRHLVALRLHSVRAYLHRPFLLAQASTWHESICILSCIQVLQILKSMYNTMEPHQRPLFFLSFYLFDASVILIIALLKNPLRIERPNLMMHINTAYDLLERLQNISNIARRGYAVLGQLLDNCADKYNQASAAATLTSSLSIPTSTHPSSDSQVVGLATVSSSTLLNTTDQVSIDSILGTSLADWIDPTNPINWQDYLDAIVRWV